MHLQLTMTSSLQPLGEAKGKIVGSLVAGDIPSTTSAIMEMKELKEAIYNHYMQTLTNECINLCSTADDSLFRNIPVTAMAKYSWSDFMKELQSKAPTLLLTLLTLVSFNDHRNTKKLGTSHFPGVCSAVAILLKERSKNMCGLQSLVSVIMYSCHCEKQVR